MFTTTLDVFIQQNVNDVKTSHLSCNSSIQFVTKRGYKNKKWLLFYMHAFAMFCFVSQSILMTLNIYAHFSHRRWQKDKKGNTIFLRENATQQLIYFYNGFLHTDTSSERLPRVAVPTRANISSIRCVFTFSIFSARAWSASFGT